MLDHEQGVAGIAEAVHHPDDAVHVARVQADAGLVQHEQGVHQGGAQGGGEVDALHLAAGQGAGLAVQRQVAQPHLVQEPYPRAQLLQDRLRHRLLVAAQLQRFQPAPQLLHRQGAHLGDGATHHLHVHRFVPQPRPLTVRTGLRRLVLAQEDPDVLLVALLLPGLQEGHDPLELLRSVEDLLPERLGELFPRRVDRDPILAGEGPEAVPLLVVAGLRPRVHGTAVDRALGVGDDELQVVLQGGAEPGALGARPVGVVEGEELGRRVEEVDLGMTGAAEVLGEGESLGRLPPVGFRLPARGHQDDRLPFPLGKGGPQGVRQAIAHLVGHLEPVHHHQDLVGVGEIPAEHAGILGISDPQVHEAPVRENPHEPHGPEVLHDQGVGHLAGELEGERHLEAGPLRELQHLVGGAAHRVRTNLPTALGTIGAAHPGPEQPQVVVDLRGRAHRGSGGLRRVLLLDRHGGTDSLDPVHRGLLHPLQELLRVGGEGLHVATLPLGEEGVQGQGGLARPRRPGDDRHGSPGKIQVDLLQVVLSGTPDADEIVHIPLR